MGRSGRQPRKSRLGAVSTKTCNYWAHFPFRGQTYAVVYQNPQEEEYGITGLRKVWLDLGQRVPEKQIPDLHPFAVNSRKRKPYTSEFRSWDSKNLPRLLLYLELRYCFGVITTQCWNVCRKNDSGRKREIVCNLNVGKIIEKRRRILRFFDFFLRVYNH